MDKNLKKKVDWNFKDFNTLLKSIVGSYVAYTGILATLLENEEN